MSNITKQIGVEVYCEQSPILGEGPMWSVTEQALYWLDIGRKIVYRKTPAAPRPQSWALPDHPGCLAELAPGSITIAMGKGLQRFDLTSGRVESLCAAPSMRVGTRFNDGKVDPQGRFWAGTMQNNFGPNGESVAVTHADGALYRFHCDGSVSTIEENVGIANTLAWSHDSKRFYFADSLRGQIYVYDFDADTGAVKNKRTFFDAAGHGVPDGSTIDVDGCLWNARWDGRAVLRITPDGKVDRSIPLPALRPTSCIFGGPNLDTLYVTSATDGLSPAQLKEFPLSGSVFALSGVGQGMPVPPLAWNTVPKGSQH